ncbi:MAG: L-threonine 3-dehydrogenase [Candidatus Bathyarchaeota archaeon]|nr:L-threonine 3-dehydrogenase [Candidatus Bathyarchaeota archaeon]
MNRILVTGASGQIGSELTPKLREIHGTENVIASGIREAREPLIGQGPYEILDVTDKERLERVVHEHEIDTIFHLAAILSAKGELKPQLAWHVNIRGLRNVLEVAREQDLTRIFHPSSIAVFGPETPKDLTPQETILRPKTVYGITKVAGELLGDYYFNNYGVDVRGVRFPGVISNVTPPGGGTTDYAVEIFYEAIKRGRYTCFVEERTVLPMIYMPDCLKATLDIMDADLSRLKHHTDFNVAGVSFSAGELALEIRKHIPDFEVSYVPDYRQEIADTWPRSVDDSAAREEWGWEPQYGLESMTSDMLDCLRSRNESGGL